MNSLRLFPDFDLQLEIARSWFKRGKTSKDVFAKFFFYFAAFNALYYLHGKIHGVRQGDEKALVSNLVGKLPAHVCETILSNHREEISFFHQHVIPRMYRSGDRDPFAEGKGHAATLGNPDSSSGERLIALGQILYIVRCNLSHGRKTDRGDDKRVIEASVPLLRTLTEEALRHSAYGP